MRVYERTVLDSSLLNYETLVQLNYMYICIVYAEVCNYSVGTEEIYLDLNLYHFKLPYISLSDNSCIIEICLFGY